MGMRRAGNGAPRSARMLRMGFCSSGSLLAFVLIGAQSLHAQAPSPRQVAAPASDIENEIVRLPDPASTPPVSRAAVLPLAFARDEGRGWRAELTLPIDRAGDVSLALLSPDAGTWSIAVGVAGAAARSIDEAFAHEHDIGPAG